MRLSDLFPALPHSTLRSELPLPTGALDSKTGIRVLEAIAKIDAELGQLEAMSAVVAPIFLLVAAFQVNMILSRLIAVVDLLPRDAARIEPGAAALMTGWG